MNPDQWHFPSYTTWHTHFVALSSLLFSNYQDHENNGFKVQINLQFTEWSNRLAFLMLWRQSVWNVNDPKLLSQIQSLEDGLSATEPKLAKRLSSCQKPMIPTASWLMLKKLGQIVGQIVIQDSIGFIWFNCYMTFRFRGLFDSQDLGVPGIISPTCQVFSQICPNLHVSPVSQVSRPAKTLSKPQLPRCERAAKCTSRTGWFYSSLVQSAEQFSVKLQRHILCCTFLHYYQKWTCILVTFYRSCGWFIGKQHQQQSQIAPKL